MSVGALLNDLVTGNFSHAWSRVQDWWSGAEPELKDFINKLATDEGKILEGLVAVAAQDVVAGGFTTASFVAAGKDVLAKLIAQNISQFNMSYVMAQLNIKVAPLAPAASAAPVVQGTP